MAQVSVVITTYNRAELLTLALNSAINQSFHDLEIIIIDDGSTDNTRAIVEEYARKDNRIKYFYQANKGISGAKNAGVKHATAEYIAFLDSDDIWEKEKTEKQMGVFKNNKIINLVYTNANLIDIKNKCLNKFYIREEDKNIKPEDFLPKLLLRDFIPFSSIIVRRDIFAQYGDFMNDYEGAEDHEWLLRISRHGHFHYIDEPLTQYRLSSGNESWNLEKRHTKSIKILNAYKNKLPTMPLNYILKLHKRFAQSYYGLGYACYEKGKYLEARQAFARAILYWPLIDAKKYLLGLLCLMPSNIIGQLKTKRT